MYVYTRSVTAKGREPSEDPQISTEQITRVMLTRFHKDI